MKRILQSGRYLVLIGVVSSLVASAAAFLWGAYKTIVLLIEIIQTQGKDVVATTGLIALMDKFLIAAGLYIFAVGMYELFIDDLDLPGWLVVHNLHDIKGRLSSVIILVLAIVFLEHVIEWKNAQDVLLTGIGIAVVTAALIGFNLYGEKEPVAPK
jgi:uncharacterized membrane protein YqhA